MHDIRNGNTQARAEASKVSNKVKHKSSIKMPLAATVDCQTEHRTKFPSCSLGIPAAVSRPVPKKEMLDSEKAMQAFDGEWGRLREQKVWDESVVKEWNDIGSEAVSYTHLTLPTKRIV